MRPIQFFRTIGYKDCTLALVNPFKDFIVPFHTFQSLTFKMDFTELITMGNKPALYFGHTFGNTNACEGIATNECRLFNPSQAIGKFNVSHAFATVESSALHLGNPIGKMDASKTIAATECAKADFFHAFGNMHFGERCAVFECSAANPNNAIGNGYTFHRREKTCFPARYPRDSRT